MSSFRVRGLIAAGAIAGMTLAFAPALAAGPWVAERDLVTAADLGMAFAPRLLQVDAPTLDARNAINALGLDVTEHASNSYVEVIATSPRDLATLDDAGFSYIVAIADLVADNSERIALDVAYAETVDGFSPLPSGRTTYRQLDDFSSDIDALVESNPTAAKRISIGKSVEGRDLFGIEVGVDVTEADDGRPVFLMFGVHHAREWPSAELPMEFATDIVQGLAGGDARITDLMSRSRLIVVPVSNPDGYGVSRMQGDLFDFSSGPAWWRKNCRVVEGQSQPEGTCQLLPLAAGQTSTIGVDLNRNYGGLWGGPGADPAPQSGTYRGPAPFSEPETQAIRSLISTRQVTTLITNHTRGRLLLRPNGVSPETMSPDGYPRGYAPDECFTIDSDGPGNGIDYGMQALGEAMTAQTGYSNQFGWELYDTTGTTEDYSYNATGGYGYTFELMPGGGSFHPAFEQVVTEYTGEFNAASNLKQLQGTPAGQAAAEARTTGGKKDCLGQQIEHSTLGGGMRESYMIALENAANASTHSVLTGTAPAGSTIQVTRTGDAPLWDGSFIEDVTTTSMVVGTGGTFEYHVNPSTRPFVASRTVTVDGVQVETPHTNEFWTVSCDGGPGVNVLIERGESVDVELLCG
ncbi:MAG: hypothetical protein ACJA2F_000924 [Nitriliruptoraceae bacterium]|jgi:hypothetical protein